MVLVRGEGDTVHGLLVDLLLRVVGSQVTPPANLGAPGLRFGETVQGMTRDARALGAVVLIRPMPVFGHVAGSSIPSPMTSTWEPWHCQQPLTAAAELPSGTIRV